MEEQSSHIKIKDTHNERIDEICCSLAAMSKQENFQDVRMVFQDGEVRGARLVLALAFPHMWEVMEERREEELVLILPHMQVVEVTNRLEDILLPKAKLEVKGEVGSDSEALQDLKEEVRSCSENEDKDMFEHMSEQTELVPLTYIPTTVPIDCQICLTSCKNASTFNYHMKTNHSEDEHKCDICNKNFKTKSNLRNHIRSKHSDGSGETSHKFSCTLCSAGNCQSKEALDKHIQDWHSGIEYPCSHCGKTFSNTTRRNLHEKNRHTEKTIQCDQCEKKFAVRYLLTAHIKTAHEKKKDKICPQCGEGFKITSSFEAHINRHTNSRQFVCKTCGKDFLIEKHLKTHMKSHNPTNKCDKCDQMFGKKSFLVDHVRKVHDKVELDCRHGCGWKCLELSNRNRHEKTYCSLNPLPNLPFSISSGNANSLTLEKYADQIGQQKT